jgi:hypothetical protein
LDHYKFLGVNNKSFLIFLRKKKRKSKFKFRFRFRRRHRRGSFRKLHYNYFFYRFLKGPRYYFNYRSNTKTIPFYLKLGRYKRRRFFLFLKNLAFNRFNMLNKLYLILLKNLSLKKFRTIFSRTNNHKKYFYNFLGYNVLKTESRFLTVSFKELFLNMLALRFYSYRFFVEYSFFLEFFSIKLQNFVFRKRLHKFKLGLLSFRIILKDYQ